ncbi:hypothetical protein VNO78_30224 [Psophocarpus tetragonolobus]|uniref:Uncharacterized protein n=1 Tax=Psophocarpus tetragonolobus TaxID=3891 RepID=A0AAN9RX02_PSOTE
MHERPGARAPSPWQAARARAHQRPGRHVARARTSALAGSARARTSALTGSARAHTSALAGSARARTSALAGSARARARKRPGRQRAHQRPGRQRARARAHQRPGRQRARARTSARARAPACTILGVSICLHAIGIVGCGWPVGVDSSERDGVVRIGPCVAYLFKVLCRLCYDSVRTSLGSRRN